MVATSWREILSDENMVEREDRRHEPALWTAGGRHGAVATAHWRATRAAAEVLERGGNAVDAAVAASFMLGVCEPAGSGVGGMAMMLVHFEGRTRFLNGGCRAPRRATPDALLASKRRYTGHGAIAVPTHVAVMMRALEEYGTVPAAALLEPAIGAATEGVPSTRLQQELTARYARSLRRNSGGSWFLDAAGRPFAPGTVRPQPALARTLERLARHGLEEFYRGSIAQDIAAEMDANGAFLSLDDLADLPRPEELEPLWGRFGGLDVAAAPSPAGGRTLLALLETYDRLPDELQDADAPLGSVAVAEAIRRARTDRRRAFRAAARGREPPDPRSAEAIAAGAAAIRRRALGEGETTHLSIVDAGGNAVALTQSLERSFGAKVVAPDLGFLFNGYLKAFNARRPGHPHYLRPGAVAKSNAAPAIAFRAGRIELVIGSTGSERMISGIFQVMLRLRRQTAFDAVAAPRLHATPEGVVLAESDRMSRAVLEALAARGYTLERQDPYSFQFGGLHLVARQDDQYCAVAEPRRDGAAAAPIGVDASCDAGIHPTST